MSSGSKPVWFIVAASSGFGHQIACEALRRGHTVIATARNAERIQDLDKSGLETMAFNVTFTPEAIANTAKEVLAKHGRVDYPVNTAGYILEAAVEGMSPQEVYDVLNTNVFGAMNTIRSFLPLMREQPLPSTGVRATIVTSGTANPTLLRTP